MTNLLAQVIMTRSTNTEACVMGNELTPNPSASHSDVAVNTFSRFSL